MKKDLFNLRLRSRWLLISLLALLAGASPAWADAYTCGFESSEGWSTEKINYVNYTTVGDGWGCIGGTTLQYYNVSEGSTYRRTGSQSLTHNASYENSTIYAVTPYLAAGTVSFYARYAQSTYNLKIYKASYNGEAYSIEGDVICSWNKNGTKLTNSFTQYSFELDEDSYVAILVDRVAIDDFSAPNGTTTPSGIAKPKNFAVSNITASSADFSWAAGSTETNWEFSYSTTSGNPNNGTIIPLTSTSYSLTGLTAETTYYASVRAKVGEEYSAWSKEISFTPTRAVQLTVHDGTSTNYYVPIYGGYVDAYDKVEFVIPASDLSDMAGCDIKALTFYLSSPAAASWGNANFKIYMTEVENTTISSYTFNDNDFTALYNGSLDGTKSEMPITLTTPYSYSGGNLLVGVYNTVKGTYKSSNFYGASADYGASAYGYNSSSLASVTSVNKQSFLPKTTFTYLPVDGAVMKVSETAFDFGTITPDSPEADKQKTFTISNKGNATLENISVSYTGDDVFSLSDGIATSIAEGGDDIIVTVTMNTTTPGDYSGTITVSATDQTPVEISLTASYAAAPATMAITIGEAAVGTTVAFGNVGKAISKTFTVTNTGNLTLNISSIVSSNTSNFTVSPATLTVAGGSSETFTVTFVYDAENLGDEKTANITITPSNEGLSPVTFAVSATSIELWSEDFSGNKLPNGWENENSSYWTFTGGYAHGVNSSSNYYLTTPSLTIEDGQSLSFDVRMTSDYYTMTIQKQKDNGSWEDCMDINRSSVDQTMNVWKTITISGLEAGNYKFRFNSRPFDLDNFEGFKLNANDPKFGIYTDSGCTTAAATSVTKDFGFVTSAPEAKIYYLKNDGTGTLTLALGDVPTGFTAVLGTTSLAAKESTTLTINMPVETKGYRGGNIVVTAKNSSDVVLGTFTVAASGVVMDVDKMYVNFASTEASIPAGWTKNSWNLTANANGYVYSGGTSNDFVSSELVVAEGDKLVISAAGNSKDSWSPTSLTVSYSADGTEWTQAANVSSQLTSTSVWKTIEIDGIPTTAKYIKFTGAYAYIQRIYGFAEPKIPFMTVYDGTTAAAASYSFDNVPNDQDATHTFTIKNEGNGMLTGVTATLSGDQAAHYTVEISGLTDGNIAAKSEATLTVTQLKDNLGAHAATLTISSTSDGIDDIVIALSGTTRDASKMYVDFADGVPSGWTNENWTTSSYGTNYGYAQAPYSGNGTLTSPALTIAAGENLTVDLSKQYNNNNAKLTFRYTTDGGITWNEQDLSSDLTYGEFTTKTLSLGNETDVTAFIQFVGTYYARIDNFYGGTTTTAPMIAVNTSETLTDGKYDFGQTLQAAPDDKVFTLTNNGTADLVSTVAATGDVTFVLATENGELTNDNKTVTLEPGETATITVSLNFDAAAPGTKEGSVTIDSNDPVADVTLNFTAKVLDATTLYIDFSNNQKPAGWYNTSWTFTNSDARYMNNNTSADLITEQFEATAEKNQLSFDAWTPSTSSYTTKQLSVWTSTDRKNWTKQKDVELTTTPTTVTLDALATGKYYVKFSGSYCAVDNITGLAKVTGIEHDFYMASYTLPTETVVPGTEYTAKINVASLRADETDLTAAIWIQKEGWENATEVGRISDQTLAVADGAKEFTITGTLPAEEGKYWIWANIWHNTNGAAETDHLEINLAHTRTLEITEFTRTSDENADADANNEFESTFTVTVKNTGTVDLAANQVSASVLLGSADGTAVLTATATEALAVDATVQLTLTGKVSAAAGGELSFYAKENLSNTTFATPQTVTVTAQAALFAINTDGSTQDFGIVKVGDEPVTKTFTVTNNGTKMLKVGFSAPEGYSYNITKQHGRIIKFTDNANWGTVYLHAWKTEDETTTALTTWPGVQLTESYSNEFSQTVYYAYVPEGATGILFHNNGGAQTHDIADFSNVEGYYSNNNWSYDKLNVISYGENTMMALAAGTSGTFTVTLNTENVGIKSGNVGLSTNAADTDWFEIPVTGRVIDASTWTENFDVATAFPTGWTGGTWTIGTNSNYTSYNSTKMANAPSGSTAGTMITPRLAAKAGDIITWDGYFKWADEIMTVEYSDDDQATWNTIYATYGTESGEKGSGQVNYHKSMSFTAPADGNYYLRFTSTYQNAVDNFVGFQLNMPEHIMAITTSSIPTSGSYSPSMKATQSFEASVTVKESRGVAEENVVAKLYMGEDVIGTSETVNFAANETKVITITATPTVAATDGVQMHIEVEYAGGTLATEAVTRYVAEFVTLALTETEGKEITTGYSAVYDQVTLTRSFVEGWNTFIAPVAVNISDIDENAVAYSFTGYAGNTLSFTKVTVESLNPATPYVVYVPAKIDEKVFTWNNPVIYSTNVGAENIKVTYNGVTFQGTYAPIAAPGMEGKYGVTTDAHIAKGSNEASIKGFRAYFEGIGDLTNARMSFTDLATGITQVIEPKPFGDNRVYNLNGQHVENAKKGLYIVNGKKVVIK